MIKFLQNDTVHVFVIARLCFTVLFRNTHHNCVIVVCLFEFYFLQRCPTGWFTCQSGSVTCIDESFMCDCSGDCDDDSDETTGYAGCSGYLLATCPSGAQRKL
jgi:hypothetical protein